MQTKQNRPLFSVREERAEMPLPELKAFLAKYFGWKEHAPGIGGRPPIGRVAWSSCVVCGLISCPIGPYIFG